MLSYLFFPYIFFSFLSSDLLNEQPHTRTPLPSSLPLPLIKSNEDKNDHEINIKNNDNSNNKNERRGFENEEEVEVEVEVEIKEESREIDIVSTGVGTFICPCAMTILKQCGGLEDLLRYVRTLQYSTCSTLQYVTILHITNVSLSI
jgi:GTP cyclohydrolase FolE2